MAGTRCPVCGAPGSACGPSPHVTPIDSPPLAAKEDGMAELKDYEVQVDGMTTVLRLTEADAKRRGLTEQKKAPAPANKARGAQSK